MRLRITVALIVMLVALVACDDSDVSQQTTTTTPPDGKVESALTTTTAETEGLLEVELTTGLVYHPQDDRFTGKSGMVDVIAPIEGGPYPTVIAIHGDPIVATKSWHRRDAMLIAEQGRVVFLPDWGHRAARSDPSDQGSAWELDARELACAIRFAHEHTAEYGGQSDHITVYGFSAGANTMLMVGLTATLPLETCSAQGEAVTPQAIVPIDADWVLGGDWDLQLSDDPEAFYQATPLRHLDGSQPLRIHVVVTENPGPEYVRTVGPDPSTSWLSYRHPDIDLVGDLEARGFLADGAFGIFESAEYAYQLLVEAGYDATFTVMPGATHMAWGERGIGVIVDTVLNAE